MPFDGTQLDETTQQLIAAREELVRRGWCTRELMNHAGQVCAMGALGWRTESLLARDKAVAKTQAAMRRLAVAIPVWHVHSYTVEDDIRRVVSYNNSQNDEAVILDWFDRAIAAGP